MNRIVVGMLHDLGPDFRRGRRAILVASATMACLAESLAQAEVRAIVLRTGERCGALTLDRDGRQFGFDGSFACYWRGSAATFAYFLPETAQIRSRVHASFGEYRGGDMAFGEFKHAYISKDGFQGLDLMMNAGRNSSIHAISPDGFVGFIESRQQSQHAAIWPEPGTNPIDLNPNAALTSSALGATAGIQVGTFVPVSAPNSTRAAFWKGSRSSFTDLSPTAKKAAAHAASGQEQFGFEDGRACGWRGTAASKFDLHPTGADTSKCLGADSIYQVGEAVFKGRTHAGLWTGTAGSFLDLHTALPKGYRSSSAKAVLFRFLPPRGNSLQFRLEVVGSASRLDEFNRKRTSAVLWLLEGVATPARSVVGSQPGKVDVRIRIGPLGRLKVRLPQVSSGPR